MNMTSTRIMYMMNMPIEIRAALDRVARKTLNRAA